jgi:hypothetical protein
VLTYVTRSRTAHAMMPGAHRKPPNDKLLIALPVFFGIVAAILLILALRMK